MASELAAKIGSLNRIQTFSTKIDLVSFVGIQIFATILHQTTK